MKNLLGREHPVDRLRNKALQSNPEQASEWTILPTETSSRRHRGGRPPRGSAHHREETLETRVASYVPWQLALGVAVADSGGERQQFH
jgi:hypothetical protein